MNKIVLLENLFLKILGIILPWIILFASPQFHIGYWGQVETMISCTYFLSAIISLLFIRIGYNNESIRKSLAHPLIMIPMFIGLYSVISSFLQRLPALALFGSPQLGQGAFWYFSMAIFTILYLVLNSNKKWMYILLLNLFLVVLAVTIGSFYPAITGVVISFFGFNDWLSLYFVSFFLILFYVIHKNFTTSFKEIVKLFLFSLLGPLFWIIDNNSAIALWVLILLSWIILYFNNILNFKIKFLKYIYNPLFFTFIPILLSIIMVVTSFIFWDGTSDQTDIITNTDSWIGHLGTLVARGSIVRVLFEHLINFKAIIFGYGWGSISELLISSFTPEVFYQINTGNRVHFHTHNEIFEHIFCIGFIGASFYVIYTYYIFKYSFEKSHSLSFLWLLYFCISTFWFQWISNIIVQALLVALLFELNGLNLPNNRFFNKFSEYFKSKVVYSICLIFISLFLFYGSYIGYSTAAKHTNSHRSAHFIALAQKAEKGESCIYDIYDYGKGALQFSQKFSGYNNYYKDQVLLYGKLNESDYQVLNWFLCASEELISNKYASLELINVHINTLSTISVLPGKEGILTRKNTKKYLDLWEEKLDLLLYIAPKRIDQSTSLISFYFKNNNYDGVERICNKINKLGYYQGYCDLAIGAIFIEKGLIDEGIFYIKRANENGVLDSSHVDTKTAEKLKKMLKNHYKSN